MLRPEQTLEELLDRCHQPHQSANAEATIAKDYASSCLVSLKGRRELKEFTYRRRVRADSSQN
jgi:hypothetical protein